MAPTARTLTLPDGYGESVRTIAWEDLRGRLEESLHYWVATTLPSGDPHVVPRWGVWVDDTWFYDGSPQTRHARNLAANPVAVMHLEDGQRAVIVRGESRPATPDRDLAGRLEAAFRKYHDLGYAPTADSWDRGGLWGLHPVEVLAWTDYPHDATRFRFG